MLLKLNGGRSVSGILRGFDPFMNVVLDETVEECKDNSQNNIGMVVRYPPKGHTSDLTVHFIKTCNFSYR